jgi:hypothetical protein
MNDYEKLLILLLILDVVVYTLSLYLIAIRGLLIIIFALLTLFTGITLNIVYDERGTVHETKA